MIASRQAPVAPIDHPPTPTSAGFNASFILAWRLALFSFVVAAFTGAFMRYGMLAGLPAGLQLGDVRHAHSHLMFFAWASPALMLFASEAVRRAGGRFSAGAWCALAAALAGLLAYTPFLLSGYRLLAVGDVELPLSMMASGINGLVWYAFALLYLRATWRRRRTVALRFMDGAVVSLVVASLGAVLLAVGGVTGTASPAQMDAFVDLFLTLFADGWFGLGLLATLLLTLFAPVVERSSRGPTRARLGAAAWLLTLGLTVRSGARLAVDAYGLHGLALVESAGGCLAALAWLAVAGALLRRRRGADAGDRTALLVAQAALALLALKAVVELVLALPAGAALVDSLGLRILLLHAFLLGAVTLALAAAMRSLLGRAAWHGLGALALAVAVMVACLLPLTGLWPAALAGRWTLSAAFYSSLGPAVAALVTLSLSSGLRRASAGPATTRTSAPGASGPPA